MTYVFKDKQALINYMKEKVEEAERRMKNVGTRSGKYKEFFGVAYTYNSMINMLEHSYFENIEGFQEPKSSI